ncbi:MAG: 16S rRNA (cytidine(1402)-2'-O)-methyltransferase [bacterium]|nr:16S rRNA (cytidine(1402)-2'-O)-methyltransferase [bacterium]
MREFDFYIVPTPIGNIQDITLRAVEILKMVDIIACEDTRTTQKLLNHYDIKTKCISYHKYNEQERVEFFLNELKNGKKIALVSDAGTPMICDPGTVILKALLENGYKVTSLPGASAVITFLSQIPRKTEEFTFIGFLPKTESQIKSTVERFREHNAVFYESPERILKTLKTIKQIRGDIRISLGRELSKLFEEVITDKISNVLEHYKSEIKGEIVCMLYADEATPDFDMISEIKKLKSKGYKDKDISVILSTLHDYNKNEVYKKSLETK